MIIANGNTANSGQLTKYFKVASNVDPIIPINSVDEASTDFVNCWGSLPIYVEGMSNESTFKIIFTYYAIFYQPE